MKTSALSVKGINEIVINAHFTEICNYSCRYCYASGISKKGEEEIFRSPSDSFNLLNELKRYFSPDNPKNPLLKKLRWSKVRLSLAGGEPLLYPDHLMRIAHQAKALGFDLSLITNASLLTYEIIPTLAVNLSILGISLDSDNHETNRQIGRCNHLGQNICLDELAEKIALARAHNPRIVIKINTVVNALNVDENLTGMIKRLRPDKWKLLRVLPVITTDLSITDQQFNSFVKRHQHFGSILSIEDHLDMTESYIMVNPCGRFFQNQQTPSSENPYIYSEPILEVGADVAFSQINFDAVKFAGRYDPHALGDAA